MRSRGQFSPDSPSTSGTGTSGCERPPTAPADIMPRPDGRAVDQLRPVLLTRDYLLHPEGSVLVEFGATKVICTASVEDRVPPFLKGQGLGCVAAISVGIVDGQAVLDLNYAEDSAAEVDMNVVMTGAGSFVEVQGTAERAAFPRERLDEMLAVAGIGIGRLVTLQRRALEKRDERLFRL